MDIQQDKTQFQTPNTVYNSETFDRFYDKADIPATPEKVQAPFQFAKDLEAIMDSCHDTAEALEQKNGHQMRIKYVPFQLTLSARPHEKILEEQLNAEREVSMRLFRDKGNSCVHYNGKAQGPYADPEIGHWYIETMINGKPGTGRMIHIETHKDFIKKFDSFGQLKPVTLADLEIIVPLMKHYVQEVMKELYPFDWDRAQVLLEGIDFPDNFEKLLLPEHHSMPLPNTVVQFTGRRHYNDIDSSDKLAA